MHIILPLTMPSQLLHSTHHLPPPLMAFGAEHSYFVTESVPALPSPSSATVVASMLPPLFNHSHPPLQSAAMVAAAAASGTSIGIQSFVSSTLDGYSCDVASHDEKKGSLVSNERDNLQGTHHQLGYLKQIRFSCSDPYDSEARNPPTLKATSIISDPSTERTRGREVSRNGAVSAVCKNANESCSVSMHARSSSTTSEEEEQHQQAKDVDDKKQKRMLSNRESARRSRLRKQQHLDDLRAQISHLTAENSLMMNRFNIASQQYTQLTDENRVLRSHAVDLSRQLDRLRQVALAQQQAAGQFFCIESSLLDPLPAYSQQQHL